MIASRASTQIVAVPVKRRLLKLQADQGLRLLQRAKAHLWTDWLSNGTEHDLAIEFLSDFIIHYGKVEGLTAQ
jgi:hypothetical protein